MVEASTRFRVLRDAEPGVPRIENVRTTPTDVKAGETFTVTYQLRNDGSGPMTGSAAIEFDCAGPVCIPTKSMITKTVQAKGSMPESAQFKMPENATPGTYSVKVRYEQQGAKEAPVRTAPTMFTSARATVS